MNNYIENEVAAIQWLNETGTAVREMLQEKGFQIISTQVFDPPIPDYDCGQESLWHKGRGKVKDEGAAAERKEKSKHMVSWIITGERVLIVGGFATQSPLTPSITVGVINYDTPLIVGWSRFQEYTHNQSSGKNGVKIKTIIDRFSQYHDISLHPEKIEEAKRGWKHASSTGNGYEESPKPTGEGNSKSELSTDTNAAVSSTTPTTEAPVKVVSKLATTGTTEDPTPALEMAPGPAGKVYVHIPMTLVPHAFAMALESLLRGANGDISMLTPGGQR